MREKTTQNNETTVKISLKGHALLCAINSGLCPPTRDTGNIPTEAFETFWGLFEQELIKSTLSTEELIRGIEQGITDANESLRHTLTD